MNRFLLLILVLISTQQVVGQEDGIHYTVGYFGNNGWNPGLKLGVQCLKSSKLKEHKSGKERVIETSYGADLGCYKDPRSHLGVFLNGGLERRKIYENRVYMVSSLNPIGVFRSFLPATYQVDDSGDITKVSLAGRWYFAPAASWGIGRNSKKNPLRGWYTKAHLMLLMPYNTYILPLLNWELGYRFTL